MKGLNQAIADQDPKKVKELLDERPHRKFNFDHEGEAKGLIPLHYLAGAEIGPRTAREIFGLLLDKRGAAKHKYQRYIDTITDDENENTALHIATKAGNSIGILALLWAGASTHIKNAEGKTPVELTKDEALQIWFKQYSHQEVRDKSFLFEITEVDRRIFSLAGITLAPQVQEISEDIKTKVRNAEFNGRPLIQEAIDRDDPYMVERLIIFYHVKTDIKVKDASGIVTYAYIKDKTNAGRKLLELKVNQEEYPAIFISSFLHNRKEFALKLFDILVGNIPSTQEKIITFRNNDTLYVVTCCRDAFSRQNINLKNFIEALPSHLSSFPSSSTSMPASHTGLASASSSSASTSVPRSMTTSASSNPGLISFLRSMTTSASSSSASISVPRSMTMSTSSSSPSTSFPRSMTTSASSNAASVPGMRFMLPYTSDFATSLQRPTYSNVPSTSAPRPVTNSGYPNYPATPTPRSTPASTSACSASASAPHSEEARDYFNREQAGTDYLHFTMSKEFICLQKGVVNGDTGIVKEYIQIKKMDVNFDYPYDKYNKNNKKTFLRFAMEAQNLEMVKLLISLGAIVYQADIDVAHSQKEMKDVLQEAFDNTTPLERIIAKYVGLNVYNTAFNENMIKNFREHSNNGASLLHLIVTDNRFPKEEIEPILRKFMEKYKLDINIKNNDGETPLHLLIKSTKLADKEERNKRILWLMTLGADINTKNKAGETPIFSAVRNGDCPLVTRLCEFGANTSLKNNKGQSLIDLARTLKGGQKTANYLSKFKGSSSPESYTVTRSTLFFSGNPAKPLPKGLWRVFRDTNETQHIELRSAVEKGDMDTVRKLIVRKQYNVNFLPTDNNSTALLIAIKASHNDMVTLLLELGALVYQDDLDCAHQSQLSSAVKEKLSHAYSVLDKHNPVNEFIVREMGLNFYEFIKVPFALTKIVVHNFKGQQESSLLHIAVTRGLKDYVAQLVVNYGMDVNLKRGKGGRTPLHLAVMLEYNAIELVETLLMLKADINIQDNNGKTAVDYAREAGKQDILDCLERRAPIVSEPSRKRLRKAT